MRRIHAPVLGLVALCSARAAERRPDPDHQGDPWALDSGRGRPGAARRHRGWWRPGPTRRPALPVPRSPGTPVRWSSPRTASGYSAVRAQSRPVVLQDAGGQDEGIAVGKTDDPACLDDPDLRIAGSVVRGFTVNGFDDDGVFLYCVDDWRGDERDRDRQPRVRRSSRPTSARGGSTTRSCRARTTPGSTSGSRTTPAWTTTSRPTT